MVGAPGDERGGVVFSSTESVPWKSLAARRSGRGVAVQVADRDQPGSDTGGEVGPGSEGSRPSPEQHRHRVRRHGVACGQVRAEAVAVEVGHRDRGRGVAGREVRVRGKRPVAEAQQHRNAVAEVRGHEVETPRRRSDRPAATA